MNKNVKLIACLVFSAVCGQTRQANSEPVKLSTLKLPLIALGSAASFDVGTTLHGKTSHDLLWPDLQVENNPLVNWAEPRIGIGGVMIMGAAMEAGAIWVGCKLLCASHPKIARGLLWVGTGLHVTYGTVNYRRERSRQRQLEREAK